jgi:four helix bundle suffix protein
MDGMDVVDQMDEEQRNDHHPPPEHIMPDTEPLIPKHGGYRNLKSFQVAQLVYDVTASFCDAHIERRSRTHDQMVQAARSGVQNIAEGSQASGTSRKMEMKLTSVARASLEELRLDYEDYLRQRGLAQWPPNHPALQRFKARRCATMEDMRNWRNEELALQSRDTDNHGHTNTDGHGHQNTDAHRPTQTGPTPLARPPSVSVRGGPCQSVLSAQLEANGALSLLNLCCYLLDRQLAAQAAAFERDGGFTERLYGRRSAERER